jgi:hypothetical protein
MEDRATVVGVDVGCHRHRVAMANPPGKDNRGIRQTEESKMYYDKKRREGKSYHQAVRAMGRHLVRVIWSMAKRGESYSVRILDGQGQKDVELIMSP